MGKANAFASCTQAHGASDWRRGDRTCVGWHALYMRAGYGADTPPVRWVMGCVALDDSGVRPTGGRRCVVS